jgi:hypothetical protein
VREYVSALAEIIQHQRRHDRGEPCEPHREPAEVAHVGVERLRSGDHEEDRREQHEGRCGMREPQADGVQRIQRRQDAGIARDLGRSRNRDRREPHEHDRTEHPADDGGAAVLHGKEHDQDDDRQRKHPRPEYGRHDLQPFHRGHDRDRRRDDAVTVEHSRPDQRQHDQAVAQSRAILQRGQRERNEREDAALAAVVGSQDEADVLDRHHHREHPERE